MKQEAPPLPPGCLHVVAAAIIDQGQCLIGQRKDAGSFPKLWEFPGGKAEEGESAEQAIIREIDEELALKVEVQNFLARGVVQAGGQQIVLDVYEASLSSSREAMQCREHLALRWIEAEQIHEFDWAAPDLPALKLLPEVLARHALKKAT